MKAEDFLDGKNQSISIDSNLGSKPAPAAPSELSPSQFINSFDQAVAARQSGDDKTAFSVFKKQADQGNAMAQVMLGAMYGDGTGVPKDEQQAVFWYRKAADQGDAVAQYNLGVMYANGTGVPKDEQHAYFWFLLASAQGFSAAVTNRYILEKLLTPQQREEAQRQARTWKPSK